MAEAIGEVMTPASSSSAAAHLRGLLSWFEDHGGSVTKLCLEDLGGEMSLSLLTGQALSKGDVVMSIPISLCMTDESVRGRAGEVVPGVGGSNFAIWLVEREQELPLRTCMDASWRLKEQRGKTLGIR